MIAEAIQHASPAGQFGHLLVIIELVEVKTGLLTLEQIGIRQEELQIQLVAALASGKNEGGGSSGRSKAKGSSDNGEMSKSRKQTAGSR